jgi:nitrogen-specific signal transduction histidine kinase
VIHYAQLELRQAGVALKLDLMPNPLPAALADDIQIQLVVLYLVRNAHRSHAAIREGERRELTLRTAAAGRRLRA